MFNLNQIRASLASFIRPVSLPVVGSPQIQLIAAPTPAAPTPTAPVASAGGLPRASLASLGINLKAADVADALVRFQHKQAMRPAATRPVPRAKSAPVPATDDDGPPAPAAPAPVDVVSDVVEKLQSCLQQLRDLHPDVSADDGDEAEGKVCLARGDKAGALRSFDAAISKMGARIAQKNASKGLRGQASSRSRASALVRSGFSGQAQIQKIEACLRPGTRPAPDPAASEPAASAPAATGGIARAREIQAARKLIDQEYRKTGIFSPAAQAQDAALLREWKAIHARFSHKQ